MGHGAYEDDNIDDTELPTDNDSANYPGEEDDEGTEADTELPAEEAEEDAVDFTEGDGNNEDGPLIDEIPVDPSNYPDDVVTDNPSGTESSDTENLEIATEDPAPAAFDTAVVQDGVLRGRSRFQNKGRTTRRQSPNGRSYGSPRRHGGGNHGCQEKINMILKKVLKKLQMSQDVENKAYEMVEEMMMDRDLPIDSDEVENSYEIFE